MAENDWVRGDWMQTYTGRPFYPLDPRPTDIDARDIAHALSLLCRYGGHVDRFYSVAEHCVLMAQAAPPEAALEALLHDATEAYVVDVPRPLKRNLPDYQAIEAGVATAIADHFGISRIEPAIVKDLDTRILANETAALMPGRNGWANELVPLHVTVEGWAPARAEAEYLGLLAILMDERHTMDDWARYAQELYPEGGGE